MNNINVILFMILGLYNLLVLGIFGADKLIAGTGARRVPEGMLIGLGVLGGGVGALGGMYLFHHKTRKLYFQLIIGGALSIEIIAVLLGKYYFF